MWKKVLSVQDFRFADLPKFYLTGLEFPGYLLRLLLGTLASLVSRNVKKKFSVSRIFSFADLPKFSLIGLEFQGYLLLLLLGTLAGLCPKE